MLTYVSTGNMRTGNGNRFYRATAPNAPPLLCFSKKLQRALSNIFPRPLKSIQSHAIQACFLLEGSSLITGES